MDVEFQEIMFALLQKTNYENPDMEQRFQMNLHSQGTTAAHPQGVNQGTAIHVILSLHKGHDNGWGP